MPSSRAFTYTRAAIAIFVVNSAVAMALYPGGTFRNRTTLGYDFFRNFLSDLGMPRGWGGGANVAGAILFVAAELIIAAALVGFFAAIVRLCAVPPARIWVRAAAWAAAAAVVGIVGAAVTPADRFFQIHNQSALLAFRALFLTTLFLAVAVARDARFSRLAAVVSIGAAAVMAAYVGVLEWGPSTRTESGLLLQATAQKVAVATLLVWFFIVSGDAGRLTRRERAA